MQMKKFISAFLVLCLLFVYIGLRFKETLSSDNQPIGISGPNLPTIGTYVADPETGTAYWITTDDYITYYIVAYSREKNMLWRSRIPQISRPYKDELRFHVIGQTKIISYSDYNCWENFNALTGHPVSDTGEDVDVSGGCKGP